jgi:hypothetical protein
VLPGRARPSPPRARVGLSGPSGQQARERSTMETSARAIPPDASRGPAPAGPGGAAFGHLCGERAPAADPYLQAVDWALDRIATEPCGRGRELFAAIALLTGRYRDFR